MQAPVNLLLQINHDIDNYRPISLLPVISKPFEITVTFDTANSPLIVLILPECHDLVSNDILLTKIAKCQNLGVVQIVLVRSNSNFHHFFTMI